MDAKELVGLVFEPHGISISGNGTIVENNYGNPRNWGPVYREEWLKRMIAYWGNDLGVPTNPDPTETHFYHREYDRCDAGPCMMQGMPVPGTRWDWSTCNQHWKRYTRANVPEDRWKRVRLAYLQDVLSAEDPPVIGNDARHTLLMEHNDLANEVSPWGGYMVEAVIGEWDKPPRTKLMPIPDGVSFTYADAEREYGA